MDTDKSNQWENCITGHAHLANHYNNNRTSKNAIQVENAFIMAVL